MTFNKDEIKNNLSIEQVENIVADLGGEPRRQEGLLICRTICHGGESHKLYYYDNTKLFRCYTECDDSFDIFELIIKVKKIDHQNWTLYNAISYVINYFGLDLDYSLLESPTIPDWGILNKWTKSNIPQDEKIIQLKIFDDSILQNLPQPHILPWEREGIKKSVCDEHNIHYDPYNHSVIIPHYNINNELVGIRERTLVKENEIYGKYRPAILNGKMYNHPLGYNLYNINNSCNNIRKFKRVFVFEGEKSCLLYSSIFGNNNDISVSCCGSNFIYYQFNLLTSLEPEEIIIAFDKQYQDLKGKEWLGWTKKLMNIHDKYGKYVQISYLFDKENLLDYKDSPIDKGKDIFIQLFEKRIIL